MQRSCWAEDLRHEVFTSIRWPALPWTEALTSAIESSPAVPTGRPRKSYRVPLGTAEFVLYPEPCCWRTFFRFVPAYRGLGEDTDWKTHCSVLPFEGSSVPGGTLSLFVSPNPAVPAGLLS